MAKHVCCITTRLLGVDVDFATWVATPTWPNSRLMRTTWLPFCYCGGKAEQTTGPTGPTGNIYPQFWYRHFSYSRIAYSSVVNAC